VPSALKRFAVSAGSSAVDVVVAVVDATADQLAAQCAALQACGGSRRALSQLSSFADWTALKKEYELSENELTADPIAGPAAGGSRGGLGGGGGARSKSSAAAAAAGSTGAAETAAKRTHAASDGAVSRMADKHLKAVKA
jgi:hypothetical protein